VFINTLTILTVELNPYRLPSAAFGRFPRGSQRSCLWEQH